MLNVEEILKRNCYIRNSVHSVHFYYKGEIYHFETVLLLWQSYQWLKPYTISTNLISLRWAYTLIGVVRAIKNPNDIKNYFYSTIKWSNWDIFISFQLKTLYWSFFSDSCSITQVHKYTINFTYLFLVYRYINSTINKIIYKIT